MGTIPPIASLTDPRNLLTLATFAGLLSMGCYAVRSRDSHHRKLLFGLCVMVIPFIPASNLFFPVGFVIAERVLYIPSMGFCMIVAYGAWLLNKHTTIFSVLIKFLLFYLIFIHGLKTLVRNQDWRDNHSLYTSALHVFPNNAKMWSNLATELSRMENKNLSEACFRQAIAIEPNFTTGYMNLGYLLKGENRTDDAIKVVIHTCTIAL